MYAFAMIFLCLRKEIGGGGLIADSATWCLGGRGLPGLRASYNEVQNNDKSNDQEVGEQFNNAFNANLLVMTGHELPIVPVLRNPPGAHRLSSQTYFIPSHRT